MIISCMKDYVSKKQVNTYATEDCGLEWYDAVSLGFSGSFEDKRRLGCQGYGYFQGPWTLAFEDGALETLKTSNPAKQPHMPDERNRQIHLCVNLKIRIIWITKKSIQ